MKNLKFLFALILFSLAFVVMMPAQVVDTTLTDPLIPTDGYFNFDQISLLENVIYGSLVTLLSYFSFAIPGIKKIPAVAIRVLVIGLILVFMFLGYKMAVGEEFNVGTFINYVITYILTTGAYDKIFKPIGAATPKALPSR